MSASRQDFNLVDSRWIMVRYSDGTEREVSLLQIFEDAPSIQCLTNELATQDFAILRVLLAIMQRAIAMQVDEDELPCVVWKRLWEQQSLPLAEITAYLAEYHERFWLFDDGCPFMQVAGMRSSNGKTSELKKLVVDIPDGRELFTLRAGSMFSALSFSEAARWLVHVQAFDSSGIKTGVVGDPAAKAGKSYPIGTGWAGQLGGVYLEGKNLRETLLLNLILWKDDADRDDLFDLFDDVPVWEQEQKSVGDEARAPFGRADLYTWQARRVVLIREKNEVVGMILTNGSRVNPLYNRWNEEPMTRWKRSEGQEKKLGIVPVYFPAQLQSGQALWRGLSSVLPLVSEDSNPRMLLPGVVLWARHLTSANGCFALAPSFPLRIHATGYEYGVQSSVVNECINDILEMHAYLVSPQGEGAAAMVAACMEDTNKAVGHLGYLARTLRLSRGDSVERARSVQKEVEAEAFFELGKHCRTWLFGIDENSDIADCRLSWNRSAFDELMSIARTLISEVGPSAVVGRRVKDGARETWENAGSAEARFFSQIKKVLPF